MLHQTRLTGKALVEFLGSLFQLLGYLFLLLLEGGLVRDRRAFDIATQAIPDVLPATPRTRRHVALLKGTFVVRTGEHLDALTIDMGGKGAAFLGFPRIDSADRRHG